MRPPLKVHLTVVAFVFIAIAFVGCEKKVDAPQQGPQPTTAAAPAAATAAAPEANHAAEGVRAGSHQDWCGEHQVPESLCTRCNSKLIAAFKATGDWCQEHGLPESQCLTCNPSLKIERPPQTGEATP